MTNGRGFDRRRTLELSPEVRTQLKGLRYAFADAESRFSACPLAAVRRDSVGSPTRIGFSHSGEQRAETEFEQLAAQGLRILENGGVRFEHPAIATGAGKWLYVVTELLDWEKPLCHGTWPDSPDPASSDRLFINIPDAFAASRLALDLVIHGTSVASQAANEAAHGFPHIPEGSEARRRSGPNPPNEQADQSTEPVIPTKAVSLGHAAREWFRCDARTLKSEIARGCRKAKQCSKNRWQFDLDEVTAMNPGARADADLGEGRPDN